MLIVVKYIRIRPSLVTLGTQSLGKDMETVICKHMCVSVHAKKILSKERFHTDPNLLKSQSLWFTVDRKDKGTD